MKSKWLLLALIAALCSAACSGESSSATTTAPPATTTTSVAPTTSTTRPPLVNGGLTPVDPATLIPLVGYNALFSGPNHVGTVSPDGRFAAVETWDEANNRGEINVVDLDDYELTSRYRPDTSIVGLTVTDEGTAYWTDGDPQIRIFELSPGATEAALVYDSTPDRYFSIGLVEVLSEGRFGFVTSNDRNETAVLLVDPSTGTRTEIPVAGVDEDAPDSADFFHVSAHAWDHNRDRILIVPGFREVVIEVDLRTATTVEHAIETGTPPDGGARRDATLDPDGSHLYVATSAGERNGESTEWTPMDLAVVDLASWATSIVDIDVDTLFSSSLSEYVMAQGTTAIEGPTEATYVSGPAYVVETETHTAVVGFQTEGDARAQIEFSNDGTLAYISTWNDNERDIKTLDLELMQVTGAVAFRKMSFIGEAGLLAFHLD